MISPPFDFTTSNSRLRCIVSAVSPQSLDSSQAMKLRLIVLLCFAATAASFGYQSQPMICITEMGSIGLALDMFENDCGRYPTTADGLAALLVCPDPALSNRWKGPYLKLGIPIDPWGQPYVYRSPGIHSNAVYELYSCGADGVSRSDGNDVDDLNSWDNSFKTRDSLWQHYNRLAKKERIITTLTSPISITVAVVLGLGLLLWMVGKSKSSEP